MNLKLIRFNESRDFGGATTGLLFVNNKFQCYVLEDEHRDTKVDGETRIPEGSYEVIKYKVDTPLTLKYRSKYDFFDYHFMLKDVPNFSNVYIHIGNYETHTDGCLLVGNTINNINKEKAMLGDSTTAFKALYEELSKESVHKIEILSI